MKYRLTVAFVPAAIFLAAILIFSSLRLGPKASPATVAPSSSPVIGSATLHPPALPPDTQLRELVHPVRFVNDRLTGGIGLLLGNNDKSEPEVMAMFAGSPAEAAGFRIGDVLVEVDGLPTSGKPLEVVSAQFQGSIGTPITVQVRSPDSTIRILTVASVKRRDLKALPVKTGFFKVPVVAGANLTAMAGLVSPPVV
ncbi:MAG: PDZ domain-containing protein [Verrucomicrobiae bacterium]|nr:PDZ domain-containing protein [Verrucomicrobiae bacterium]